MFDLKFVDILLVYYVNITISLEDENLHFKEFNEDEFYEDMQKRMPKINSRVVTPDGNGVVSNTDFLRETVTVTFTKNDESTEIKTYPLSEVTKEKK